MGLGSDRSEAGGSSASTYYRQRPSSAGVSRSSRSCPSSAAGRCSVVIGPPSPNQEQKRDRVEARDRCPDCKTPLPRCLCDYCRPCPKDACIPAGPPTRSTGFSFPVAQRGFRMRKYRPIPVAQKPDSSPELVSKIFADKTQKPRSKSPDTTPKSISPRPKAKSKSPQRPTSTCRLCSPRLLPATAKFASGVSPPGGEPRSDAGNVAIGRQRTFMKSTEASQMRARIEGCQRGGFVKCPNKECETQEVQIGRNNRIVYSEEVHAALKTRGGAIWEQHLLMQQQKILGQTSTSKGQEQMFASTIADLRNRSGPEVLLDRSASTQK